jgi:hypothetical protein
MEKPIFELSDPVINGSLIYYRNKSGLMAFDTDSESFEIYEDLSDDFSGSAGLAIYNGRLYSILPAKDQIYRYNNSASGLGAASAWMNDQIDLQKAMSLSIDGHIYVISSDGSAYKLLRGEIVDFKLSAIEPALEEPAKIIASPDQNYLYILESSKNRIIIYDKEGSFIGQYRSDSLDEIKDFLIDEKNKTFYFLNGSRLLRSNMPHLDEAQ